jgi:hypothetical protein
VGEANLARNRTALKRTGRVVEMEAAHKLADKKPNYKTSYL